MVRTRARLVALLTALAGCGLVEPSSDLGTTTTDAERAAVAWSDPWAAPDTPTLPGADATGANPVRDAGTRTTTYDDLGVRAAALREHATASGLGWDLLGVGCDDAADEVVMVLDRGSGLGDTVRAEVAVAPRPATTVELRLQVPHHADGGWPDPPAVDVADTCLAGSDGGGLPTSLDGAPYDPDSGEPGPEEPAEWRRAELPAADLALRAALKADPWYAGLDADVEEASVRAGPEPRSGAVATARVTTTAGRPAPALAEAARPMTDWEVTWATCRGRGPAALSARLVTDDGVVTARLTSAGDGAVGVEVRSPVPEAPRFATLTAPPALTEPTCLGGAEPGAGVVEGVPVANPARLQPYLG